jgi:S-adenosyl-L-methionine hydrolase (adenosine-forming)
VTAAAASARATVTLLTDFSTPDGYAGEIKGAILTGAPAAQIIDISHDMPPHDVDLARLTLARYWRRFPPGTVHLAVVDPGVGSARLALAVESDGRFLVGPDNGVLSPALLVPGAVAVTLPVPPHAAPTFHGRDVFAPAAAALASGASLESLGEPAPEPVIRRTPEPRRLESGALEGEVIAVDRFGNAVTNLMTAHGGSVLVEGWTLPVLVTYSDRAPGEPLALVGSSGLIEIAVSEGDAARRLGLQRGSRVVLEPA